MFVYSVLLTVLLFNYVRAQFPFDLPIVDTVKFNHEYDFIVIGGGSGKFFFGFRLEFIYQNLAESKKILQFSLFRWLCYGK